MELAEEFVETEVRKTPLLFYLWGHSFEFDRDGNWDVIERFLTSVGGREEIWYATNLEIYDYVQAYSQLQFRMDGSMVRNPTAITVYFDVDGMVRKVESGETISIHPGVFHTPGLRTEY